MTDKTKTETKTHHSKIPPELAPASIDARLRDVFARYRVTSFESFEMTVTKDSSGARQVNIKTNITCEELHPRAAIDTLESESEWRRG